jgi:tetratricopeptide (TPR) repeat protein
MARLTRILLVSFILIGLGFAQTVTRDSLEIMLGKAKNHYYNGEYQSAIRELENALLYLRQLKQTDQVEAYKYLAFSYVAFGDRIKAKEQFKNALLLNPELELDPATVSPKIIKVFEEAKAEMAVAPPITEPVEPVPRKDKEEISGFDATIRSCCVGGWGQMYRGESSKGKKMMIAWGVTGGATLVTWIIAGKKENDYQDLRSIQPEDYDDAYEQYKLWVNIAAANTIVFLGVHAYNLFDIIFRKPRTSTSMIERERGFICEAYLDRVKIGYTLNF